jgi:hypothetical protein
MPIQYTGGPAGGNIGHCHLEEKIRREGREKGRKYSRKRKEEERKRKFKSQG